MNGCLRPATARRQPTPGGHLRHAIHLRPRPSADRPKRPKNTLLIVSILPPDNEIDGDFGQQALARLKTPLAAWNQAGDLPARTKALGNRAPQALARHDRPSKPLAAQDDAMARAYVSIYGAQHNEFPSASRGAATKRRISQKPTPSTRTFDARRNDWSTLDKFQRTRGVLRLWRRSSIACERSDGILLHHAPATVPIDDPTVQFEPTPLSGPVDAGHRQDVDGENSLPLKLERDAPFNFGPLFRLAVAWPALSYRLRAPTRRQSLASTNSKSNSAASAGRNRSNFWRRLCVA